MYWSWIGKLRQREFAKLENHTTFKVLIIEVPMVVFFFQTTIFTGINKKMALYQHDYTSQLNYCSNEWFSQ